MTSSLARRLGLGLALAVSFGMTARELVLPLLANREQRGAYLYGRYHLEEIYLGVPFLILGLALLAVALCPARRRQAVAFRLAALLLGCGVPLAAFDLGYSLFYIGAIRPAYWLDLQHISRLENVADDRLGFRRKPLIEWRSSGTETEAPYHYRTDENGFRNAPGTRKAQIAFVGDSYTEAAQVAEEDTFAGLVGRRAKRTVLNLGRGAYGPQQELMILEEYALAAEPEVIVWQFFEGNDLADAQEFQVWRENKDRVIRTLADRYFANSFFHPFLLPTARSRNKVEALFDHGGGRESPVRLRYRWMPRQALERSAAFDLTVAALLRGQELAAARGIELVVLFIPTQVRVNARRIRFADEAEAARFLPEPTGDPTDADFGSALMRVAAGHDIPFLDLFGPFRAQSLEDPTGLYIPGDEHLDLLGHEIAARVILDWLERR